MHNTYNMKDLPEYVLKYKKKGTSIKYSKGNYYLYKTRSQREPGKKYPVLKSEYLGVITEDKGLITPHPSVNGDIEVLKSGAILIAEQTVSELLKVGEFYQQRKELLYVRSVLYCFGYRETQLSYENNYISKLYPNLNILSSLSDNEERTLTRLKRQMIDKLKVTFTNDWERIQILSQYLYVVHVNSKWRNSVISCELADLATKYKLDLGIKEDDI